VPVLDRPGWATSEESKRRPWPDPSEILATVVDDFQSVEFWDDPISYAHACGLEIITEKDVSDARATWRVIAGYREGLERLTSKAAVEKLMDDFEGDQ
jgi:hypothetical protein